MTTTTRPPGLPRRMAVSGRPSTDEPITWSTAAAVVVVDGGAVVDVVVVVEAVVVVAAGVGSGRGGEIDVLAAMAVVVVAVAVVLAGVFVDVVVGAVDAEEQATSTIAGSVTQASHRVKELVPEIMF